MFNKKYGKKEHKLLKSASVVRLQKICAVFIVVASSCVKMMAISMLAKLLFL
jgi:hypothetical protein